MLGRTDSRHIQFRVFGMLDVQRVSCHRHLVCAAMIADMSFSADCSLRLLFHRDESTVSLDNAICLPRSVQALPAHPPTFSRALTISFFFHHQYVTPGHPTVAGGARRRLPGSATVPGPPPVVRPPEVPAVFPAFGSDCRVSPQEAPGRR